MRSTASNPRALDHPRINYLGLAIASPDPPAEKKEKLSGWSRGCGFPPLKRWERRASGRRPLPIGSWLQNTKKSRHVAGFAKLSVREGYFAAPLPSQTRGHMSQGYSSRRNSTMPCLGTTADSPLSMFLIETVASRASFSPSTSAYRYPIRFA